MVLISMPIRMTPFCRLVMIIASHSEGSELAASAPSTDYSGKVHTENHGSKCSFVRVFLSSNSRLRIWMYIEFVHTLF